MLCHAFLLSSCDCSACAECIACWTAGGIYSVVPGEFCTASMPCLPAEQRVGLHLLHHVLNALRAGRLARSTVQPRVSAVLQSCHCFLLSSCNCFACAKCLLRAGQLERSTVQPRVSAVLQSCHRFLLSSCNCFACAKCLLLDD
jgi:hypothetical protein